MKKLLAIIAILLLAGLVALLFMPEAQEEKVHIGQEYRDGFGNIITIRDIGSGDDIIKRYPGDINLMLGPRDSLYVVFVDPSSQTLSKMEVGKFLAQHTLVK